MDLRSTLSVKFVVDPNCHLMLAELSWRSHVGSAIRCYFLNIQTTLQPILVYRFVDNDFSLFTPFLHFWELDFLNPNGRFQSGAPISTISFPFQFQSLASFFNVFKLVDRLQCEIFSCAPYHGLVRSFFPCDVIFRLRTLKLQ